MKKSQVITIVVLLVVLGLCVAGYFVGKQYFADKEKKEEAAKKTIVLEIETPNITEMKYTYNGKTYTVLKTNNIWENADDKKMKLNQTDVSKMASGLAKVQATAVIKKPKSLAQYGFVEGDDGIKPETQEINLKTKDNKVYTIYVGKENPYDQGSTYIMIKGDDKVYLVDYETVGEFKKTVNELEQEETTANANANGNVGVMQ